MSIKEKQIALGEALGALPDHEERFAWLMAAGRRYPAIDPRYRVDAFLLPGCVSQLWLYAEIRDGVCHFEMDGDAQITKGIAAVVCGLYEGETPADVLATELNFLVEAGLSQVLSTNRSNGLASLRRRIREFAQAHLPTPAEDMKWMTRALALARQGEGRTDPNPIVGAVIVRDGVWLGEGYHERDGGPHAEVNALADALFRCADVAGATMYVTMEPCSTPGRTGACTTKIIRHRLGRVVIGAIDSHPAHQGRGVTLLREAGIKVTTGVLGEACTALNPRFNARMAALAAGPVVTSP